MGPVQRPREVDDDHANLFFFFLVIMVWPYTMLRKLDREINDKACFLYCIKSIYTKKANYSKSQQVRNLPNI